MERLEVLRREFERVAAQTDAAYQELEAGQQTAATSTKLLEASYRDWAALLLRYHDTLARAEGSEPRDAPMSMKGSPTRPPPEDSPSVEIKGP